MGITIEIATYLLALTQCGSTHFLEQDKAHYTMEGFTNITSYEKSDFFGFLKWRRQPLWRKMPKSEDYRFSIHTNPSLCLKSKGEGFLVLMDGHTITLDSFPISGNVFLLKVFRKGARYMSKTIHLSPELDIETTYWNIMWKIHLSFLISLKLDNFSSWMLLYK